MSEYRYLQPPESTAEQVRSALAEGRDSTEVANLLVGAALHDPDARAVEDLCVELLTGSDRSLAGLAATCLGHLARIHGALDLDRVLPLLMTARDDPVVGPHAEDALDDIDTFLGIDPR